MIPAPVRFDARKVSTNKKSFRKFLITVGSVSLFVLLSIMAGGCNFVTSNDPPRQINVEYVNVFCQPKDPLDRVQYEHGERIDARSVTILGDGLIAVGTWNEDVFFVDVTDPERPTIVSVFRSPGYSPGNVVAINGYAYMSGSAGIVVADIREPTRPKWTKLILEDGAILAAEDDRLYIVDRSGPGGIPRGVQIWDTTNPRSLTLAGVYIPLQHRVGKNQLAFKRRGIPSARQLAADIAVYADAATISETQSYSCSPGITWDADIENELLYVSVAGALCQRDDKIRAYKGGLWIVDVKDPIEPTAVGFLPTGAVYDIKVEGDYAYLGTALPAFQIVDISDPEKPTLVGTHDAPEIASVVEVEDNIAYIGDRTGLHIFDVTNPAKPIRIGLMEGFFDIDDIASRNGIIYLAGVYQGPVDQAGTCQSEESISTDGVHFLRVIDPEAGPFERQGDMENSKAEEGQQEGLK